MGCVTATCGKERPAGPHRVRWAALQRQIDRLVYELYDLTEDEIRIVGEAVG